MKDEDINEALRELELSEKDKEFVQGYVACLAEFIKQNGNTVNTEYRAVWNALGLSLPTMIRNGCGEDDIATITPHLDYLNHVKESIGAMRERKKREDKMS